METVNRMEIFGIRGNNMSVEDRIELNSTDWNRRLFIDCHLPNAGSGESEILAVIAISRPLDGLAEQSNSLAYPLDRAKLKTVIEQLTKIYME